MLLIIKLPQGEIPFKEVLPEAPYVPLFSESFVCDVSLWLHVPYSYPPLPFLVSILSKIVACKLLTCTHYIYSLYMLVCTKTESGMLISL